MDIFSPFDRAGESLNFIYTWISYPLGSPSGADAFIKESIYLSELSYNAD